MQNLTQSQLVRRYLAYRFLTNMWFVGAIWLYLYRIFITDQQVGILDGAAFAIGLLAEVPSGALADKFGRDRIVKLGQFLIGGGLLFQATGSNFWVFFVGQSVMMIGVAFASGADDALFFDKLQYDRRSIKWRKLTTRGGQADLVGSLIAMIIGGALHTINPRLPWALTGMAFLAALVPIWQIHETRTARRKQAFIAEINDYLHDIRTGFAQFRLPQLRPYVPIILTVQGLFYATGYGLLRLLLLSRFHFTPFQGSVLIAICSVISIAALALMHRYAEHFKETAVLVLIAAFAGGSLLMSLGSIGYIGAIAIFILYIGERLIAPFMSDILNRHAPDNQRATVLSVGSFFKVLPYVFLGPIIGSLSTHGKLNYSLVLWPVLIAGAVILHLALRQQAQINQ